MRFKLNENLSIADRKKLIKGLTKVAELYFNGEHQTWGTYLDKLTIGCGICRALSSIKVENAYYLMNQLMEETHEYSYGDYVRTPEEWEPRANMCLFLVEYLKDSIKKEKS